MLKTVVATKGRITRSLADTSLSMDVAPSQIIGFPAADWSGATAAAVVVVAVGSRVGCVTALLLRFAAAAGSKLVAVADSWRRGAGVGRSL